MTDDLRLTREEWEHEWAEKERQRYEDEFVAEQYYMECDRQWRRHHARFSTVCDVYPHMVALAYGGDIEAPRDETDAQVAERVAAWERAQGNNPIDWHLIAAYGRIPVPDDPHGAGIREWEREQADERERVHGIAF